MDTRAGLAGTHATISRSAAVRALVTGFGTDACFISALGYLSRDLYNFAPSCRSRCFYCMGSMGSVIPLALGISLRRPDVHVVALEGDGSLLSNLGCLATVARYARENLSVVVFDNRLYESSGGQPSQPECLHIEDICRAVPLATVVATNHKDLRGVTTALAGRSPDYRVLVLKVCPEPASPRIPDAPGILARRFAAWLQSRAGS